MVSATEPNVIPQPSMADIEKKSLKKLFKVFFKKDKKGPKEDSKEKQNETDKVKDNPQTSIAAIAIENVLQNIEKLTIQDKDELQNFTYKTVDIKDPVADELDNFTFKTVKDDGRNDRTDSHSSEDSGFADKEDATSDTEDRDTDEVIEGEKEIEDATSDGEDRDRDVIEGLEKLSLDKDDSKKDKRVQTVVVARTPIRQKVSNYKSGPYIVHNTDQCRQIQVNKHTLTGGQVIVSRRSDLQELDAALLQVQRTAQRSDDRDAWLSIITEVIQEDSEQCKATPIETPKAVEDPVDDFLSEFFLPDMQQEYQTNVIPPTAIPPTVIPPIVQEPTMTPPHQHTEAYQSPESSEFTNNLNYEFFGDLDLVSSLALDSNQQFIFPTPPHSENAASPMSDSQGSFRASEYTYSPGRSIILSSPERSSPICNSDYEKFQEITHEDISISNDDENPRERKNSASSMTMKQYKDLQKEISHSFSKKDCCQISRKSCRQLFQEHLQKLSVEERKNICLKVAKMELKYAYGVLQNILKSLSQSFDLEDLHHALFCLVCERVLAQAPEWLVGDFGLNLLKSAALRCPGKPLLTRYIVQCVRTAIRAKPDLLQGKDSVFHEVDANGDTLIIACARRGDSCADVLSEILRKETEDLPLFRMHHVNADGASALHVACSEHSASEPRLHIVHVLLEHGGADLWQGDAKAGDTPVHMAVNSKNCDLRLLMVMFRHVDRKLWKKLAHAPNLCSTTPLEYARSATKSQVRDGYPTEVLEFLKKCR